MDQIDPTLVSHAGYALIAAGVVAALLFGIFKNRRLQVREPRRDYRCLTIRLPLDRNLLDDGGQGDQRDRDCAGLHP